MEKLKTLQDAVSQLACSLDTRSFITKKYGCIQWGDREHLLSILNDFGIFIIDNKEDSK